MKKKNYLGSVIELLEYSFPIIIAHASESLMMFTDRYLLLSVDKAYPTAVMSGGFLAYLWSLIPIGAITFITPLVAQYRGAGQLKNIHKALGQCIWLCFFSFLLLNITGIFCPSYFKVLENLGFVTPGQELVLDYFYLMNGFSLLFLLNVLFSHYFIGLGNTKVVMHVNLWALLLNLPLSYYLIHNGVFGFWDGIKGAALGTGVAHLFMLGMYLRTWSSIEKLSLAEVKEALSIDIHEMKKIVQFGVPTGIEYFLLFFAFSTFTHFFHSYGETEAISMTAVFNWDILATLPMWGLNIGISGLTGQYLGEGRPDLAQKTTYSGAKIAFSIVGFFAFSFLFFGEQMTKVFMPHAAELGESYPEALNLARHMLVGVTLYSIASATSLVFTAPLRASGDSKWCMLVSIVINWSMLAITFFCIQYLGMPPLMTWWVFICCNVLLAILETRRFFKGTWKVSLVIKNNI